MRDMGGELQSIKVPGVSFFTTMGLPTPWPLKQDRVVFEDKAFRLTVLWKSSGRIEAEISDERGDVCARGKTARIRIRGRGHAVIVFSVSWKRGDKDIIIAVNGSPSNTRTSIVRLAAKIHDDCQLPDMPNAIDAESLDARKRRSQRVAEYKERGIDEERQATYFRREVKLLDSALCRLGGGDKDELVNVSIHLRKLIGKGRGDHSLQDFAALQGLNLDVWTSAPSSPGAWTPLEVAEDINFWTTSLFSIERSVRLFWPQDFDAWLNRNGGVLVGRPISNLQKLHVIADKVGAHLDVDSTPEIDKMAEIKIFETDTVEVFLKSLGYAVLELSRRLIDDSKDC